MPHQSIPTASTEAGPGVRLTSTSYFVPPVRYPNPQASFVFMYGRILCRTVVLVNRPPRLNRRITLCGLTASTDTHGEPRSEGKHNG